MHFTQSTVVILGFPGGSDGKESACNAGDSGLTPRSGRSPGERNGYPFLPGESHGQKSLVSYSPWGLTELDMTEQLTCSKVLRILLSKWFAQHIWGMTTSVRKTDI